jgi:hypothetical protein
MQILALVAAITFASLFASGKVLATERVDKPGINVHFPFHPGERLTYIVSWSKVISAGTAVMEVRKETTEGKEDLLLFTSTARTTGMVDKFYPVTDTVHSIVDQRTFQSISYELNASHGKRKRKRKLLFDHKKGKATYIADGVEETVDIPENTQDALSSLYYIRMRPEFVDGKVITVNINDMGKNWAVEVYVLGRERIETPVGEFNTIKLKTYPKYEGVFMHQGEIFIWITDDSRRIPVLMKSTIAIGSIVAMLSEMKLGENEP